MFRTRILLAAVSLLAGSMLYAGCGGGHSGVGDSLASGKGRPGNQMGLPAIDQLPEATHQVSQLGPGWFPVDLNEQGVMVARSGNGSVLPAAGGKRFEADDNPTWAMFAVRGFDHDASPTALRVESDAPDGGYFVGETSYETGRWIFHGPFGGDTEIEYADAGHQYDPDNHVSPTGSHFIAIVANAGVDMLVSGVELGVDGGDNAPLPIPLIGLDSFSGDAGISILWPGAYGESIPDYLGAFLERATWPSFDYETIGGPVLDKHFLDSDVVLGTKYRYRVRHEDVSGNASWSMSITEIAGAGDMPPIAILDIPAGPLFGRQTVNFDMSASYDPDGDAITEYRLEFGFPGFNTGIDPLVSASSQSDVELQPGAYWIRVVVTANGKNGDALYKLKVFPAWQTEPELVSPGQKGDWRMQRNRTLYFPQTDEMLTFHDAPLLPGVGLHIQGSDGSQSRMGLPYMREGVEWISEPVIHSGQAWIAVRDDGNVFLASYDGSNFHWLDNFIAAYPGGYEQCDLVVDGDGKLRLCYLWEVNPGDWRIDAMDVFNFETVPVSPISNSDGWFDVEWNPVHGTFDVVYPMVGSSHFQRLDPVGGPVDMEVVIAVAPTFVDLEVDPVSGQASVVERIGALHLYIPYDDGTSAFLAPEIIDNAANNTEFADMIFVDSEATVFFGLVGQPSHLYRHNGGAWDPVLGDWAAESGLHCSIAAWPDETVYIVDGSVNGGIFINSIDAADTVNELHQIQGGTYQGRDLHAVAGNDGLHAYWIIGDTGVHYIGDPDGTNWGPSADEGQAFAVDLMADREGDVYLSSSWGASHDLYSWNGAAWVFEGSSDTFNASQAWFAAQDNAFGGQWWAHDHSIIPPRIRRMHDEDGLGMLPDSYVFDATNIFEGTSLTTFGGYSSFVLTGTGSTHDASVGFLDNETASYGEVIQGFAASADLTWTSGRQLDACFYIGNPAIPKEAYWAAFKSFDIGASRIEVSNFIGGTSIDNIEGFESLIDVDTFTGFLSTVSSAQAWSNTAVGVADQFFGDWHRMEWSNYGDFEEVPSPDIDWSMSSMHELVVGEDGQWHLLYRDMNDGNIYCISTT